MLGGCSGSDESGGPSGSLDLRLELGDGSEIDELSYVITRDDMKPMSGTIDVGAPGATASLEVYGLAPDDGYQVTMMGDTTDGDYSCKGSANFAVEVGVSTPVMLFLHCKPSTRLGGVRANGELNFCAQLSKVVVSPLQTSVGSDISLSASASDLDGDEVDILWTASGGAIDEPNASDTSFRCTGPGSYTIDVVASDNAECLDLWSVQVSCVEGSGELECVADEDCTRIFPTECLEPPTCTGPGNTCEIGDPLPEGSPCLRGRCDGAGVCFISVCVTPADCAAWFPPSECRQPSACEVESIEPFRSYCIVGDTLPAGTPCSRGECNGDGECTGANTPKREAIEVACSNSVAPDRSTLPSHLVVTPPAEWKDDPAETDVWTIGGEAVFDKAFLDRAQSVIRGGTKFANLIDLRWTVHLRSGGTMDDIALTLPELPYTCGRSPDPTAECDPANDLPGIPGSRGNTDCVPVGSYNPCGRFVELPTSEDCGPSGVCEMLDGGTGVETRQCAANGFCISGPLRMPLQPQQVEITPDAAGVDLVFGWYETDARNPDGTIALPTAVFSKPPGPIGFRANADGLGIGLECVLGGDAGWTFYGPYPVPDSALLHYPVPDAP